MLLLAVQVHKVPLWGGGGVPGSEKKKDCSKHFYFNENKFGTKNDILAQTLQSTCI